MIFNGDHKATIPQTTVVLMVASNRVERIKTLIAAYVDLPPTDELQLLLLELRKQLP